MPRQGCYHEVLAHSPLCSIEFCPQCNILHLTLGAFTLRLAPDACQAVWRTLGQALARLEQRADRDEVEDVSGYHASWTLLHRKTPHS